MSIEVNIEEWIFNTLSQSYPVFNDMPICPFAKQAWLDNKVYIKYNQEINTQEDVALLDYYEVIIYAYDPADISPESLSANAKQACGDQIVALEDHPASKEEIQGISLNNGTYALILVQNRHKLEQARRVLDAKGYYDNWPEDYLDEVLSQ